MSFIQTIIRQYAEYNNRYLRWLHLLIAPLVGCLVLWLGYQLNIVPMQQQLLNNKKHYQQRFAQQQQQQQQQKMQQTLIQQLQSVKLACLTSLLTAADRFKQYTINPASKLSDCPTKQKLAVLSLLKHRIYHPNWLLILAQLAARYQISLELLTVSALKTVDVGKVQSLQFKMFGQYPNLVQLVEQLLQQPLISLSMLKFQYLTADPTLNMVELTGMAEFHLLQLPTGITTIDYQQALANLPKRYVPSNWNIPTRIARWTKPRTINKNLLQWSLNELRFLGIVEQHQQRSAIVADPTGQIFYVKIGELLGNQGGHIIRITSETIVTSNPSYTLVRTASLNQQLQLN